MEEQQGDEFDYANMPSLVNLPAQIFMSHTDPPFLYQYVGDQVRIIQVLGEDPLVTRSNNNIDTIEHSVITDKNVNDNLDKSEHKVANKSSEKVIESTRTPIESTLETSKDSSENTTDLAKELETVPNISISSEISNFPEPVKNDTENDKCDISENVTVIKEHSPESKNINNKKEIENVVTENTNEPDVETESLNASLNDNNLAESGDDEASFSTPDNSPKSKRKLVKGKYGKGKAPPPPIVDNIDGPKEYIYEIGLNVCDTTSQESLVDIVNRMPNIPIKESGTFNKDNKSLQVVNPIAENKRRHKAKSPGKIPKGNTTTISRLLQLPSKLAFWNKNDDTNRSKSEVSEMSDYSRRSSHIDQGVIDEFQSCADLSRIIPLETSERTDDQFSFKDAFVESEDMTQDIIDKSDALQKLIEAKIESHPEYKIVALKAEISTTSKSTDV